MFDIPESARWALGALGSIFVWLYLEAKGMKKNIAAKVDQAQWEKEIAEMDKRSKETNERIEKQAEAKIDGMFNRLNDRMNTIDDKIDTVGENLSEKMDLIRELMSKKP